METVLGLLGMIAWIVTVIAIAAAVTYVVVRLTPERRKREPEATSES
jgi:hypothetical protein